MSASFPRIFGIFNSFPFLKQERSSARAASLDRANSILADSNKSLKSLDNKISILKKENNDLRGFLDQLTLPERKFTEFIQAVTEKPKFASSKELLENTNLTTLDIVSKEIKEAEVNKVNKAPKLPPKKQTRNSH